MYFVYFTLKESFNHLDQTLPREDLFAKSSGEKSLTCFYMKGNGRAADR